MDKQTDTSCQIMPSNTKCISNTMMAVSASICPPARPDKPCARPDKPCACPDKPCARPDKPCARLDKPCARPDKPCARPDKPCARPDKPCARPDKPCARPHNSCALSGAPYFGRMRWQRPFESYRLRSVTKCMHSHSFISGKRHRKAYVRRGRGRRIRASIFSRHTPRIALYVCVHTMSALTSQLRRRAGPCSKLTWQRFVIQGHKMCVCGSQQVHEL
jgi:hypothetical protein